MTTVELRKAVDIKLIIIGYTATDADQDHLDYAVDQAAQYVCTYCNFAKCPDDIPKSLQHVVANYAIGRFLQYKLTFAPSDLKNLNLDTVVKQITTGDTTTTFAIGEGSQTDEQKLNAIISYLITYGKHELRCHRRLKW